MKSLLAFCVGLAVLPALFAIENTYVTGKIVNVEDKVDTEVLYYMVDTPVTRDHPYFEISVQVKDVVYLGVYRPRHDKDLLPPEWIPGAEVKVKLEEKRMTLLTPGEHEIEMPISKRTDVKAVETAAPPNKH